MTIDTDVEKDLSVGSASREKGNDEEYPLSKLRLVLVILPVTCAYFLLMLDTSIVSTAVPQITSDFHSLVDVGWYGSAYQLGYSAVQPLTGKLYTYFNTKWVFLACFAVFELGSTLCGAAQSSTMLIVGRAVAGLGASGLMNGALTILSACVRPHKQPMVMGMTVSIGQLGMASGPLIGGAFTEKVSWRWCFYINLPVGAVVGLLLLFLQVPEHSPKPAPREVLRTAVQSLDLVGFALSAPSVVMLMLALQWGGNKYPWDSSHIIGLFVGSGATFLVFLAWEYRRGDDAMIPFSLLRNRIVWSAAGTMFCICGTIFVANYYLPIYFQVVKNDSALMSGVHLLPTILAQVVMALLAGSMVQRFGYYLPSIVIGTSLATIGYGLFSLFDPSTRVRDWIGYQILFGAGCGMSASMPFIAIPSLIPRPKIPIAMAIVVFCQYLGGAVVLSAAQTIFTNTLRSEITENLPGTNPERFVAAGARAARELVPPSQLMTLLEAYSSSVQKVIYLGIALAGTAFLFCWGLGWHDVRASKDGAGEQKQEKKAEEAS